MIFYIYKISNLINSKFYIGQTIKPIEKRFNVHKRESNKDHIKLHNAFNKYGRENFSIECIAICSNQDSANYLEINYINEYDSIKNGYNIIEGGQVGTIGYHHTDAAKAKMSAAKKGKPAYNKGKPGLPNSGSFKKGQIVSIETKKKLSKANKGKPWSETRRKAHKSTNIEELELETF